MRSSGDLISSLKDSNPAAGFTSNWSTLSWTASTPVNTLLRFQAAGSNSMSGPFNFVGPDGTAATYYTTSGGSLSQFNGDRYLQYRAFLSTTDSTVTPTLNDATVCYSNILGPPADLSIANNDGVTTATPGGSVTYTITASNAGPTQRAELDRRRYVPGLADLHVDLQRIERRHVHGIGFRQHQRLGQPAERRQRDLHGDVHDLGVGDRFARATRRR